LLTIKNKEMKQLRFKKEVEFKKGENYSVCLRGARRYDTSGEFDLSLYTPDFSENPKAIAYIISQNNYSFYNLTDKDYADNYDIDARTYGGLLKAMQTVYTDFEDREIVTILKFSIG
jgi:hypothetical protein